MDEKTIARNLKKTRLRMKMTLQELADRTGLTKGYLSRIERSEKAPPYSTLSKIVGAMGLEITDVLQAQVHLALVVCKNPQLANFLRQIFCMLLGIRLFHTQ